MTDGTIPVTLIQYYWNGSKFYRSSYNTIDVYRDIVFEPNPNEISKSVETPFRISSLGLASTSGRRRLCKGKWRKKIKTEYTLTGECDAALRRKLEWAAQRWAKWLFFEYNIHATDPKDLRMKMECPSPDNSTYYATGTNEYVYVVFNTIEFTLTTKTHQGGNPWYRYTIKLTRVDNRDVSGSYPSTVL